MGFPDSSVGKESACNAGDTSFIPGLGRSAGEGIGYPLQYSWASLVAQLVRPGFYPWVGNIPWSRERLPTPVFLVFPCGSAGKESACNSEDLGLSPGLGRSPGEGKGGPLGSLSWTFSGFLRRKLMSITSDLSAFLIYSFKALHWLR